MSLHKLRAVQEHSKPVTTVYNASSVPDLLKERKEWNIKTRLSTQSTKASESLKDAYTDALLFTGVGPTPPSYVGLFVSLFTITPFCWWFFINSPEFLRGKLLLFSVSVSLLMMPVSL